MQFSLYRLNSYGKCSMTVTAAFPKKCTLLDSPVKRNKFFSVPFLFKCFFAEEKSAITFSDLSIPWSSDVTKAEIQTIVIDLKIKTCSIFAQLLDNSGRVVSTPFPVACTTSGETHVKTRIGLQEFQKIRLFLHNSSEINAPDIIVIGKYFLSNDSVMLSKELKRKIIKQKKKRSNLKLFYGNNS